MECEECKAIMDYDQNCKVAEERNRILCCKCNDLLYSAVWGADNMLISSPYTKITTYYPKWEPKIHTSIPTNPRKRRVAELEFLEFCRNCRHRYSPVCKYCELDGTCSRHGISYEYNKELETWCCSICGRTFDEDWEEAKTKSWNAVTVLVPVDKEC